MNFKHVIKTQLITFGSLGAIAIIIGVISNLYMKIGGYNYYYMPFKIKVTSCGSSLGAYTSCTYPWFPVGLILSLIFWIVLYVGISLLINWLLNRTKP